MMHMFGGYGGMGYGGFGMIFMILFWGLVIGLVVTLVSKTMTRPSPEQDDSPVDIAKQRYARGEISKDEFDRLCQELQ